MDKDIYVILEPIDMKAENPQNHHIIPAKMDSDGNVTFPRTLCCDGKWRVDSKTTILDWQKIETKESLRIALAKLQNTGKNVCGTCVSTLYADSDTNA